MRDKTNLSLKLATGFVCTSLIGTVGFAKTLVTQTPEHVSGELVVKFNTNQPSVMARAQAFNALEKVLGNDSIANVKPFLIDKSTYKIKLNREKDLVGALSLLKQQKNIKFAEPNFIYRALDVVADPTPVIPDPIAPNDPDFAKLWGIHNVGQIDSKGQTGTPGIDIGVFPIWGMGNHGDHKVVVAVIDTGVDWNHPDLKDNIYTNSGESGDKAENGVDDDGNGFIDDLHGWNFADNTRNSIDDHDHGSHCSGTIGASGNNGLGVAGVNWNVSIMPIKFLSADGSGDLEGAVSAINYATKMKVNIMSNSWGGGGFSDIMLEAIKKSRDAGILFVAAAGNESNNNDSNPTYPASYESENVLSVAAIDNQAKIAYFSNYGTKTVHVAAPGVNVYSTTKGGQYGNMSGTSMAAPHVSGIAALLWSIKPEMTYADIKQKLILTSTPVKGLKRKVAAKGIVNAYQALMDIIPPTDEPNDALWKSIDYKVESPHPYKDHADLSFAVDVPGAKYIRVIFDKVDVEANYDKVIVEDSKGELSDEFTGQLTNVTSEYVQGSKAVIKLKADESNVGYGFKVSRVEVIMEDQGVGRL